MWNFYILVLVWSVWLVQYHHNGSDDVLVNGLSSSSSSTAAAAAAVCQYIAGTIHASFDSRWLVIPSGCRTGLERSTATRSERAFSFRLPPRTEDCSVPVVVPWMWSDNVLCFICAPVAQCWSVTMYWLLQTDCWHCTVVLQQQCDNAT